MSSISNKYIKGPKVNPSAKKDSLEAKQPYVDNGISRISPERYFSAEFMEKEWENLWSKVWLIAGPTSDLAKTGDYFIFEIGRESLIITKNEKNQIKAFYNVCSHRGNKLILNERGNLSTITCSFHSWKYNLDGELIKITDEESFREGVICQNAGLSEVLCETYAGLIFINMDSKACPLKERLGLPEGYLESYSIDKMKVARHVQSEWEANWKTGVDAFYEVYHLHAVHPETRTVMDDVETQYDLYPHGASRMIVPIGRKSSRVNDQKTVDIGLETMLTSAGIENRDFPEDAKLVRNTLQKHKRNLAKEMGFDYSNLTDGQLTDSWATGIFPNVQLGLHPEGIFLMRFLPHPYDPERFFYDTMTLCRSSDNPAYRVPDWMGLPEDLDLSDFSRPMTEHFAPNEPANLGLVLDQDSQLLPRIQKGIKSKGFKGPLWSEQEQRLRHFHCELDLYLEQSK